MNSIASDFTMIAFGVSGGEVGVLRADSTCDATAEVMEEKRVVAAIVCQ
jgi:hypothetical protein